LTSCKKDAAVAVEGDAEVDTELPDLAGAVKAVANSTAKGAKSLAGEAPEGGFIAKIVAFVKKQCDSLVEFITGGGSESGASANATAAGNSSGVAAAGDAEVAAEDALPAPPVKGKKGAKKAKPAKAPVEEEEEEE
jgi:hypothetical protein